MANAKKIQTDEKKQHFDDIYFMPTPVPYKVRIMDALEYISDEFNREMFDAHILPWIVERKQDGTSASSSASGAVRFLDLCSCFGNTTMATVHGMTYSEICTNWSDEISCQTIDRPRRFDCHVTAVDVSEPALSYGRKVGLYDAGIVCDLNHRESEAFQEALVAMAGTDVCISTASLVYLELESIEMLVSAFARSGKGSDGNAVSRTDTTTGDDTIVSNGREGGYMMVNFLNPFALEKADQTKQILLKYLDFCGSRATRHRRMSQLEQENYPGEEWSLLELWVLKRKNN
jgi:hypothetical protein